MSDTPLIRFSGSRLITTSLAISNHFGKKHQHILEAIRSLDCSPGFIESNFRLNSYSDSINRKLPMYEITRDGFVYLCMGFTGQAAALWKERYITSFNQMEAALKAPVAALPAPAAPALSPTLRNLLREHYLERHPEARALKRVCKLEQLTDPERARRCGISLKAFTHRRAEMAELGLIDWAPDAARSQNGRKGRHAQLIARQARLVALVAQAEGGAA